MFQLILLKSLLYLQHVTVEGATNIYKNSMTITSAVTGSVGSWISSKIASRKKRDIGKVKVKQLDSDQ